MAFFRNYSNGMDSQNDLNEKSEQCNAKEAHNSEGNEDDDSSCEKDFELKMDDHSRSEDEQIDASSLQDETAFMGRRTHNPQPPGRKATVVGKWGSSFWKDCQPMRPPEGSESARDLKNMDSDYKSEEGSDNNSLDEKEDRVATEDCDDVQIEAEEGQRGQTDVPAEEMLSDDYYEQDGEEVSDSLHYRGLNRSTASSSRPQSGSLTVNKNMSRGSKSVNVREYDDDDDYEDDDEDDEDEDDPDDVDFEPDFGVTEGRSRNKDKEWDSDGTDEDDDNDDDLDISDENDMDYSRKPRQKGRGKGGRRLQSREQKSFSTQIRQKRGKNIWEDEDSSAKDSQNESDEDFKSSTRGGIHLRKTNGGRSTISANSTGRNGEVRSSSRSVPKISYVESDGSEELDEGKTQKSQKV